jgi:hypothetical protein
MTAAALHEEIDRRIAKGNPAALLGQPGDRRTVFVTLNRRVHKCDYEAAACLINRGGVMSDFSDICKQYGWAGLPPELENAA